MNFWAVTLTYLCGFVGGIAFALFVYLNEPQLLWVMGATLALSRFALWLNRGP